MSNKYVWQDLNKANRNHYICEVRDTLNPSMSPVNSRYFDGTQAAAIAFFMKEKDIVKYIDREDGRYSVTMRANSITLNWKNDKEGI